MIRPGAVLYSARFSSSRRAVFQRCRSFVAAKSTSLMSCLLTPGTERLTRTNTSWYFKSSPSRKRPAEPVHKGNHAMEAALFPNPALRKEIEQKVQAESHMCWTCQSCANECPVNIGTGRLQPHKIVRMANLGLLDELLQTPEIWYCQACNHCNQVCPMTVKPAEIIQFARSEIIQRNRIGYDTLCRYKDLFGRFQRVRWNMAKRSGHQQDISLSKSKWHEWLNRPIQSPNSTVAHASMFSYSQNFRKAINNANASSCFTCRECSSACPVVYERGVFDPVWIFRMANFGLAEEILTSPSIWLCIACQRCTSACSQLVEGHLIIQGLQQTAIDEGMVDKSFPLIWKEFSTELYPHLLDEIDSLFGFC